MPGCLDDDRLDQEAGVLPPGRDSRGEEHYAVECDHGDHQVLGVAQGSAIIDLMTRLLVSSFLQPRQCAALRLAIEMDERLGGGHAHLPAPPLRHDLVMLPPDPLAILTDVGEQGGLFLLDD